MRWMKLEPVIQSEVSQKEKHQYSILNGNPLQYSCLENPMGRGAWWATVHGVTKSRTRLSDFTFTKIEPHVAVAVDLQHPLRDLRVE